MTETKYLTHTCNGCLENANYKLDESTIPKPDSVDLKQAETSPHNETDDGATAN